MIKKMNDAAIAGLVCGKTVWRCQVNRYGEVTIQEILLKGRKLTPGKKSCNAGSVKIGSFDIGDGWYLNSLRCHRSIATFSKRKYALEYQRRINDPEFAKVREDAAEHWADCDGWDRAFM